MGVTYSKCGSAHIVTPTSCTCMYFTAMSIPCRHIFNFLVTNEQDAFAPDLCAQRWRLDYYYNSHPALNEVTNVPAPTPVSLVKARIPSEIEKYKKTATVTKDINNIVSNMSNARYNFFYTKLEDLRKELLSPNQDNADSLPRQENSSSSSMAFGKAATLICEGIHSI